MDDMTREELVARIEAGETGPELLCAIARLVRWRFDEGLIGSYSAEVTLNKIVDSENYDEAVLFLSIPSWRTSVDATVALLGGMAWAINSDGTGHVGIPPNMRTATTNNPAAALVAAWLKATA